MNQLTKRLTAGGMHSLSFFGGNCERRDAGFVETINVDIQNTLEEA